MTPWGAGALLSFCVLGCLALAATADALPSACDGLKLTAAGMKATRDLLCQAKAAAKGAPLAPSCRSAATLGLQKGFEKAEKKADCTSFGDAALLADLLGRYATRFDSLLRPSADKNKCAAKKLTATGRDAAARLRCEARAAKKDAPVVPECTARAAEGLAESFDKAERKPPCLTTGDAGTNDALAAELAACMVAPSPTTCRTVAIHQIQIAPGTIAGYVPLDALGVTPIPIGDENFINFSVPAFVYAGGIHTRIGIDANGYVVVGGATAGDNNCCDPAIPSTLRPNNVLAPFWTDLDGTGAPGILVTTVTDGVNTWIVIEWRVNVFGTTSLRTFQLWIGVNGVEDIVFAYDPSALPAAPFFQPFYVGAENADGSEGATLGADVLPTQDLRVTSTSTL